MKKIFISYCRDDLSEVRKLVSELKLRGLDTWQDINNLSYGHPTESQIQDALKNECDAVIVYLTSNVMNKPDYVVNVELRAAFQRSPGIPIIPIFRKISISDAKQLTLSIIGKDITSHAGVVIPDNVIGIETKFKEIAIKGLREHLRQISISNQSNPNTLNQINFRLRTFPFSWSGSTILNLDWTDPFGNGSGYPSSGDWADKLLPAMFDVKNALVSTFGGQTFFVQPKARLSVGFALGFAFRLGAHLDIEQESTNTSHIWSTKGSVVNKNPLTVNAVAGEISSKDLAVELSIDNDVTAGVSEVVRQRGSDFRARVQMMANNLSRTFIADGQHAFDVASQVYQEIRSKLNLYNTETVHFFGAIPFGLAALIGHQLNACVPIQCYEYNNGYECSCLLE